MNSAAAEIQREKRSATPARLCVVLGAITLAALWFVLCRHLSSEWSVNEQYSYGWFVPFFAGLLFWLRWEDRPESRPAEGGAGKVGMAIGLAILAWLILLPLRLFEVANPDWRPLGWLHTGAVATITLLLIWRVGGSPWLRHFAFPIAFFFVAVPWVSPIEQPIVQGLMRLVAAAATETLTLFGIPAQLEGNLIRVGSGLVGVNEACSGVRSLQTSIMIGLLFGELKRLSIARRVLLLVGAVALAILANFGRAFLLVWVAATRGAEAVAAWHDAAGYAIVGIVFLGSLGLTGWLGKGGSRKAESVNESPSREPFHFRLPLSAFIFSLAWLVVIEVGVEMWYQAHEKNLAARQGWNIRPPENAPGFREIKIDEGVRQTLRFDYGREVTWKTTDAAAPGVSTTNFLFFFRWNPGSSSVVRARAHRPDICLPSAGWKQIADRGIKAYPARDGIVLPMRRVSFGHENGNAVVHTFFCLQEDKIRTDEARPDLQLAAGVQPDWSLAARARAVRLGVRNLGQQVVEFVLVSNRPVEAESVEPAVEQMIRDLVVPEGGSR